MNRRDFLKTIGAAIGATFVAKMPKTVEKQKQLFLTADIMRFDTNGELVFEHVDRMPVDEFRTRYGIGYIGKENGNVMVRTDE